MRNHEVTQPGALLKPDGSLREPGWSKQLLQVYNRADIQAPAHRIKEWDYYLVLADTFGAAFTISDDGYVGLQSASFLDFASVWEHTETVLTAFPMGRLHLPSTSQSGDTVFQNKRLHMRFEVTPGQRRIRCDFSHFYGHEPFACDITLAQPKTDTMVIATPWKEKKTAFYYNQKINCMPASGWIKFGGKTYTFDPTRNFGTLDWGRGVWTYDNTWYWGSGNAVIGGKPFGFNIGYGFGDTSAASENILFYDGVCHKLDDVEFHIPKPYYTAPWRFTSSDGRFEADFHPILDRAAKIDVGVIVTDQHQVFGRMTGKAVLDDGTVLEMKDLLCFAEDVHNRY